MLKITHEINRFDEWEVSFLKYKINACLEVKQTTLPIIINSYGGEAYALTAMIDMLKASGLKIITVALGKAMSCGAILFALGEKRYVTENTSLMVHDVIGMTLGKISERESALNEAKDISERVFKILDENTNNSNGFWKSLIKENNGADLYLNAQQALSYNLATDIGLPKMVDIFGSDELDDEEEKESDISSYNNKIVMESNVKFYNNALIDNLNNIPKVPKDNINSKPMEGNKTMFKLEREKYLNDTKNFMENKISVHDFKDDMFETEQAYNIYLEGKKDLLDFKKSFDVPSPKVEKESFDVPSPKVEEESFDAKRFEEEMMQKANLMIETQNKRNELSSKVQELVKNAKITPAVADKHLETIKLSNELSTMETIINSLNDLPSNKSYSTNEFITSVGNKLSMNKDINISDKDINKYLGIKTNLNSQNISKEENQETLESVVTMKLMEQYANENKIDIYANEKSFLNVYNKITNQE